jgi:Ca-activated chloride channel family protein
VQLSFKRVGYKPIVMQDVKVIEGRSVTVDVTLQVQSLILTGVVTTGLAEPATGSRAPFSVAPMPGEKSAVAAWSARSNVTIQMRNPYSIVFIPPSQERRVPCAQAPCPHNTESYAGIVDNPFLGPMGNPLSTFSVDVDRASYSNVRRFINSGELPPKDAVRIEEFLNYFPYELSAPAAGSEHPFAITTEVAAAPWKREHRLVRIGLQGVKLSTASLPASNLVLLIDVSGSMQAPNKLPLVKQSLRLLVDQLREQDRISMVVYAGSAGLVLAPTSGAAKETIIRAIDRLEAGGSTAGGAGLKLAYNVARQNFMPGGNNRVILATDGDFNVGVSSDSEMGRLIEEERQHGVFLTVLGFGMGNYKDSRLETLADKGNGNYAYIDDLMEARKMLVNEMGGTLVTIAKDVKIQVEFNPSRVRAYRLIGYENRALRAEDFADDRKDAGEIGAGHSVTALYELALTGTPSDLVVRSADSLRYQTQAGARPNAFSDELMFVKVRYKQPDSGTSTLLTHVVSDRTSAPSADFTFASAVAALGMIMRDSEHKGAASIEDVLSMAQRSLGADPHGYRSEFVQLVRAYDALVQAQRSQQRGERSPEKE